MHIHDDADMGSVVTQTVKAVLEAARHIGKADREITAEQIAQLETAIKQLRAALRQRGADDADRT